MSATGTDDIDFKGKQLPISDTVKQTKINRFLYHESASAKQLSVPRERFCYQRNRIVGILIDFSYCSITGTKTVGTSNRFIPVSKRSTEYREPIISF